jgi:hypothetical protein
VGEGNLRRWALEGHPNINGGETVITEGLKLMDRERVEVVEAPLVGWRHEVIGPGVSRCPYDPDVS